MKIFAVFSLCALFSLNHLGALEHLYVLNENGTLSGGNFISIVHEETGVAEGYVNCNGFDMTHPIDIILNGTQTKAYVVSDTLNVVTVIDAVNNIAVGRVNDVANPFNAPVFIDINFPFGTKAYVANEAGSTGNLGSISIINLATDTVTGKVDDTLAPVDLPIWVAFSNSGTKAYVPNFNGKNVSVIDATTDKATGYVTNVVHPFVEPLSVVWSADDTKAYVGDLNNSTGGFVAVIDTSTNTVTGIVSTGVFPAFSIPDNMIVGPDGTLYIADQGNNQVYVVNTTTNAVTSTLSGSFSSPIGMAISSDDNIMYIANSGSNTVSIVDLTTRTQIGFANDSVFPFATPYEIALTEESQNVLPLPPECIVGKQQTNRFASQSELFNTIRWCASPSSAITQYNVYRNGTLIESISVNGKRSFEEHNMKKGVVTVYGVTAVNAIGSESQAVTVSVP